MKRTYLLVLLMLLSFTVSGFAAQQTKPTDYILTLTSTDLREYKFLKLYEALRQEFSHPSNGQAYKVINENIHANVVRTNEMADAVVERLRKKYPNRPKLIVINGNTAWMICKPLFDKEWKGVPIISCYCYPKMPKTVGAYLQELTGDSLQQLLCPIEESTKGYNIVNITQPIFAHETLRLMLQLKPDMTSVCLISDQRFMGAIVRQELKNAINEYYPKLKIQFLTAPKITTEELLDRLSTLDQHTGVIYSSWFYSLSNLHQSSQAKTRAMINAYSNVPIVTITDINAGEGFAIGGCYIPNSRFIANCINVAHRMLNGETVKTIGHNISENPQTILDQNQLIYAKIDPNLWPEDAEYVNRQPSFLEKYWFYDICILVLLGLLGYMFIILRRNKALTLSHRSMIENTQVPYISYKKILDNEKRMTDFIFLDVNRMFEILFDCDRQRIIGKKLSEAAEEFPLLKYIADSELGEFSQIVLPDKSGGMRHIQQVVRDELSNGVTNAYGVDISEAYSERQRADKYKSFVEEVIDRMPVAAYVYEVDSDRFTLWNKKMEQLSGYTADEIMLHRTQTFDQNPELERIYNAIQTWLMTGEKRATSIISYKHPDGRVLSCYNSREIITHPDGKSWLFIASWDITQMENSRETVEELNRQLQLVLRVAKISVWTWNLQTDEILCNNSYANSPDNVMKDKVIMSGQEFIRDINPEDRPKVTSEISLVRSRKKDSYAAEFRFLNFLLNKPNVYIWIHTFATVLQRDEEGSPSVLIGATTNVNRRKEMEEDLRNAKNAAERSNKLKSAFLANMSHEIRTPLNAIVGFSDVLAQASDPAEKRQYVEIIEDNNVLLLQLISDILDLSKIEAGTLEFNFTDVDVNDLFTELERSARLKSANHHDVEITFTEKVSKLIFHTDQTRLMQVMWNFMNNAIKYTSKGYIHFGYRLAKDELLYFFLTDTGTGIAKDAQAAIFDRFVKLDSFKQGTGLGLSICKSIVEKLNGQIGVTSEEGKGSTFWFTVPYLAPMQLKLEQKKISNYEEEEKKILAGKERPIILIAEDNEGNYKLFQSILKNDYELIHAWDGAEAVKLFQEKKPHIILMDIKMPIMDGYTATAQIRQISQSVPIIAVTAYAFEEDETRILKSGFNAYVAKPIKVRTLREKIVDLLSKRLIFC